MCLKVFDNDGSDREGYANNLALEIGMCKRRVRGMGKVNTEEIARMSTLDKRGVEGQFGRGGGV